MPIVQAVDFSIVMPVFNREDLTQQCLSTLLPTLAGAGTGEVIVVDNGSEPATAAVLAEHPWVRVIRNEKNLGFAAACNQGTRAAQGRFVVHLNNDTVGRDGWLAAMLRVFAEEENVGIVGARLLFPDGTLQHAGVVAGPMRLGPEGFGPYHFLWQRAPDHPAAIHRTDYDVVTGACLVMERAMYLELGGFDEVYWNGYEDVDLCYKARSRGLRVIYEPSAVLVHFESQSGIQRKRRLLHNIRELAERWRDTVVPDHNRWSERAGFIRRETIFGGPPQLSVPPLAVLVHGDAPADAQAWLAHATSGRHPIVEVIWAAAGKPPKGAVARTDPRAALAEVMELRGDRYLVVVDTATHVEREWLSDLIDTVEFGGDLCAATVVDAEELDPRSMPLTADARCTLLALRQFPQHLDVDRTMGTIDGAVAALVSEAVALGRGVRATRRPTARLGPDRDDATFARRFGRSIALARRADPVRLEELSRRANGTVGLSIVLVTCNLSKDATNAIMSLREFVRIPYELIVVDNGSLAEHRDAIAGIAGIRFIASPVNVGNAAARNLGARYATGTHLLFLDDDTVVAPQAVESLLAAFADDRVLGMTAPVTNNGDVGQTVGAAYANTEQLVAITLERHRDYLGIRVPCDAVGGFCVCISRVAWDAVGGYDGRFASGTFESEDLCIRIRSAGYSIDVCEDAFVHHSGGGSLRANGASYPIDKSQAWSALATKFGMTPKMPEYPIHHYVAAARGGFRAKHRGDATTNI